jgi:hypothetical protein
VLKNQRSAIVRKRDARPPRVSEGRSLTRTTFGLQRTGRLDELPRHLELIHSIGEQIDRLLGEQIDRRPTVTFEHIVASKDWS